MNNDLFKDMLKGSKVSNSFDTAVTKVRNRSYFIGSINEAGGFSMAIFPAEHTTVDSANAECLRLAKTNPGTAYFVARFTQGCLVPRVVGQFEF